MKCKKCKSNDVKINMVQVASGGTTKHTSIIEKAGRVTMIGATCGLWALVPKKKETTKTKYKNEKHAVCQTCGYDWKL